MNINNFLRNLTHQLQLLRRLPARYVLPSLSFIRNTTRQILRHHLHTPSNLPMHPPSHMLFLSLSLSGSPKVGPLSNLGLSNLHPSQQKLHIPPMQLAKSRSLRRPPQRHDRMLLVHLIHRLKVVALRNATPPFLNHLLHRLFKRARDATRSHQ